VQSQTHRDFEHIVVDDGSSDGTADILKSFRDKITYIRQENSGTHAALNAGIRASSGEYIAILDSDDAWLPTKLELQMRRFEQFKDAGLVYSRARIIDSSGDLEESQELGRAVSDPEHAYEELLHDNPIPALTAVFRRTCIEELGGFNESLTAMSDWDLWIRISDRWPVVFVPEVLALYRIHGTNTWHSLLRNGRVNKERLLLLTNAHKATGDGPDADKKKELIEELFRQRALTTGYGLWYRHQYSAAASYILFALRLRPILLKHALLALRPRLVPRLMIGERGTRLWPGQKRS
jgi:glycosyltransferase involved in cell wall biosynthesis